MSKLEKIMKVIGDLSDSEKVSLWNRYIIEVNCPDDHIYNMEEFDMVMRGKPPKEIVMRVHFGGLNPTEDWFWFDGYENLVSTDWLESKNSPYDPDAIAEWILDNENPLGIYGLEEVLNSAP